MRDIHLLRPRYRPRNRINCDPLVDPPGKTVQRTFARCHQFETGGSSANPSTFFQEAPDIQVEVGAPPQSSTDTERRLLPCRKRSGYLAARNNGRPERHESAVLCSRSDWCQCAQQDRRTYDPHAMTIALPTAAREEPLQIVVQSHCTAKLANLSQASLSCVHDKAPASAPALRSATVNR